MPVEPDPPFPTPSSESGLYTPIITLNIHERAYWRSVLNTNLSDVFLRSFFSEREAMEPWSDPNPTSTTTPAPSRTRNSTLSVRNPDPDCAACVIQEARREGRTPEDLSKRGTEGKAQKVDTRGHGVPNDDDGEVTWVDRAPRREPDYVTRMYSNRTFHAFPRLPVELRLQIWQLALHEDDGRVVLLQHRTGPVKRLWFKALRSLLPKRRKSSVDDTASSSAFIPPLLHVSQESRSVALRVYDIFTLPPVPRYPVDNSDLPDLYGFDLVPRRFYFNPSTDVFGLPSLKTRGVEYEMYRDFFTASSGLELSHSLRSVLIRDTTEARSWWASFRTLADLRKVFPRLEVVNVLVKGERRLRRMKKGERVGGLRAVEERDDEDRTYHTMRWLSWGVLGALNGTAKEGETKVQLRFVEAVLE